MLELCKTRSTTNSFAQIEGHSAIFVSYKYFVHIHIIKWLLQFQEFFPIYERNKTHDDLFILHFLINFCNRDQQKLKKERKRKYTEQENKSNFKSENRPR